VAYRRWLSTLAFDHPAQQIAFQDYVDAVSDAERRLKRVEEQTRCRLLNLTVAGSRHNRLEGVQTRG